MGPASQVFIHFFPNYFSVLFFYLKRADFKPNFEGQYLPQKCSEKYETNFAGVFPLEPERIYLEFIFWHLFDELEGVFDAYLCFFG